MLRILPLTTQIKHLFAALSRLAGLTTCKNAVKAHVENSGTTFIFGLVNALTQQSKPNGGLG